MKVLHLMPYAPVPAISGGTLRNYHLLRQLAEHHRVTLLCFGDHRERRKVQEAFDGLLSDVQMVPYSWKARFKRIGQSLALFTSGSYYLQSFTSRAMQRRINELCTRTSFDVIQVESYLMGDYEFSGHPVTILDSHNIEHDLLKRMWEKSEDPVRKWFYWREYKTARREEIRIHNKFDLIFLTSDRDRALIEAEVPTNYKYVIPNGVNTSYFKSNDTAPESYSLVFTGTMSYEPNHDGIIYFLNEIFPRILRVIPQAKIYIVGSNPRPELLGLQSEQVVVTGYVEDVRPYIERAALYVVPLRMGGGTRLKVLEACAMKKPVVTTELGCEGIAAENEVNMLIRDHPQAFADAVTELLNQPEKRKELGNNGYKLIKKKYDWTAVTRTMVNVYGNLMVQNAVKFQANLPALSEKQQVEPIHYPSTDMLKLQPAHHSNTNK